jgi:putative ABC transport system permease protein
MVYAASPNSPVKYGPILEPTFAEIQKQSAAFENLAMYGAGPTSLTGMGEPIPVKGWTVTTDFWPALGVNTALGRTFRDEDGADVVVLSDKLWRSHFNSDRTVIGQSIKLDGQPHTILGVMPPNFAFPSGAELWTSLRPTPAGSGNVWMRFVLGRTKPDVAVGQADAEVRTIGIHSEDFQRFSKGMTIGAVGLQEAVVGKIRLALLVLLGAVGFVLLIACANVANLLLARAPGRVQEIAVRASLGASRRRLVQQLLTESSLLALAGGVLGLIVAAWSVPLLVALVPKEMIPRLAEVQINTRVFWFTMLLCMLTSLLFGVAPAIQLSKARWSESVRRSDRRYTSGQRLRNVLVATEIALSLVLLIGAGLMIKSFIRLRSVNPGFDPEHVMVLSVNLPFDEPRSVAQLTAYHQQVLDKFAALPEVKSVGAIDWLPFEGALIRGDFYAEGKPRNVTRFNVSKPGVSPGYFRAMGISLLRGRVFNEHDTAEPPGVAIVSKTVARRVWGDEDPIGKRVTLEDSPKPKDWLTVVGVVDDVKQADLAEKAPIPAVYQPMTQITRPFFLMHMAYVVRAGGDPSLLAGLMRARFRELDPNQPIQIISSMDELISATTAQPRFYSRLLGAFSALALMLASVGIYGVMAYSVAQRTREIGIRVALGAQPGDIFQSVIARSAVLVFIGVIAGLAGALATTRVLRTFLFEVQPNDAATFTGVSVVLVLVAMLATYLPAKRAMTVDPAVALREE